MKHHNALQKQVCAEIKLSHTEYFESKLAEKILQHTEVTVQGVQKVSRKILMMLANSSVAFFIQTINFKSKIEDELYNKKFFGHCHKHNHLDPKTIKQDIVNTLSLPQVPLPQVMQVHAIFIHRFFSALNKDKALHESIQEKRNKIFTQSGLFNHDKRGRIFIERKTQLTQKIGLARHTFFNRKLNDSSLHEPAYQHFTPDPSSCDYELIKSKNIPFAAGKSRHTGSFLLLMEAASLTTEEKRQYLFAIYAFLIGGGNHSLYETTIVAKTIYGGDHNKIPTRFKEIPGYATFKEEFHQYLTEDNAIKYTI